LEIGLEIGIKVWKLEIGWKLELRFGSWKLEIGLKIGSRVWNLESGLEI
jgi:hypothetical protein